MQHSTLLGFGVFRQDRTIDAKKLGIACVQFFEREIAAVDRPLNPEDLDYIADYLPGLRDSDAVAVHAKPRNLHVQIWKSRHLRERGPPLVDRRLRAGSQHARLHQDHAYVRKRLDQFYSVGRL